MRKMKIMGGAQALPDGVRAYHILPAFTFVDARGDKAFAGDHSYSLSVSWMVWGLTICFGK